jgi:hypothetical protein
MPHWPSFVSSHLEPNVPLLGTGSELIQEGKKQNKKYKKGDKN